MSDLTQEFIELVPNHIELKQQEESSNSIHFNNYTSDIQLMLISMLSLMQLQKEKYIAKTQIGSNFTDKERDMIDEQIRTSIAICSDKIKDLQRMLEEQQSFLVVSNKTEYAHKEIVLHCLVSNLNRTILNFQEFKLYRQRQRERVAKLTKLSSVNYGNKNEKPILQRTQNEHPLCEENMQLQKKYTSDIASVMNVQSQVKEISETIKKMGEIIAHQEMTTESILNEAMESLLHIEKANKNLIDATKMNEDFGRRWSLLFLGMAFFLLFYDFINC